MHIRSAEFVKSSKHVKDCPEAPFPEYAFLGRSNVGKSTLINMVTGRSKLAKTSSSPGKTQLINHFLINDAWYLTDLPGYGFARVPIPIKKKWEHMIKNYMQNRENLMCSFILLDSRHGPMKNDLEFLEWVGSNALPLCLVFTKADKLSKSQLQRNLSLYQKKLSEQWEPLPRMIVSSSTTKDGKEEILKLISQSNKIFVPPKPF